MYIVIEGQDATGKSTQAQLLTEHLRRQGAKVTHYSESGTDSSDKFVTEIAKLMYVSKQDIDMRTRTLLYLVNRYEQWRKLAEPALSRGETVITTRNWYSTLIYEGYAGQVPESLITKLHYAVMPERYFHPDKIVILTLSDSKRQERLATQAQTQNRSTEVFKSKPSSFQKAVNLGYLQIAEKYHVPTLDASGDINSVQTDLKQLFGL